MMCRALKPAKKLMRYFASAQSCRGVFVRARPSRVLCRGAFFSFSLYSAAALAQNTAFAAASAQNAPPAAQMPAPFEAYGPPLPLKRKFINSGVLKPKIKLPPPQAPEFPSFSDSVFVPKFFDSHERFERTDLSGISRLRFLTSADFFPFNYKTANGDLAGYNIDLARALCAELRLENICLIEAAPWPELQTRLQAGEGDALIAGLAPTRQNRVFLQFSRAYLRFPARFITLAGSIIAADAKNFMRQGYGFSEFLLLRGASLKLGAVSGTAHEQMLKAYFAARLEPKQAAAPKIAGAEAPQSFYQSSYRSGTAASYNAGGKNALRLITYPNRAALLAALRAKQIDLAFGDGMGFALLINEQNAQQAAEPSAVPAAAPRFAFLGGAYPGIGYLGQGMRIAVRQNRPQLTQALNYALQQLERKGRLAELYLRYFPVGFY